MPLLDRIIRRHALLRDVGEIHAKNGSWILSWSRHGTVALTESPAPSTKDPRRALDPSRGTKAVRWAWYSTLFPSQVLRYPIWSNVMPKAGIKITDTVEQVKAKIERAYEDFVAKLRAQGAEAITFSEQWLPEVEAWLSGTSRRYPTTVEWYREYIAPAEFVPKTMKPIKAKGLDFEITVAANAFKVYSRYESHPGGDDSYSGYESKSPAAARKLYLLLMKNPKALEQISMDKFSEFLRANKVPYQYLQSVWR